MPSWLVFSSLGRAVLVRVLAGGIVLCSWARHFTLLVYVSLHPGVFMSASEFNAVDITL